MTLLYKNKIRDHLSEETGVQEILDLDVSVMKWGETTFFLVDVSVDERKSELGILSDVDIIMQEIDRLSISTWKSTKLITKTCSIRRAENQICYPPALISYMEMRAVSGKLYADLVDLFESSDDDDESFPISHVFTVYEDVSSSSSDDEGSDVDSLADIEPQYITEDHFVSVLRNAYSNWSWVLSFR
jgi:hypothetical protein